MTYVVETANYFSEGYCYGGCDSLYACSSLERCGSNGCGTQTLPAQTIMLFTWLFVVGQDTVIVMIVEHKDVGIYVSC